MDGGFSIADLLPGLPAAPAAGPPEAAQAAEFKNYLQDAALRKLAAPEVGTGPPGGNGKSRGALLGGFRPGGGDLPPGADPLPPGMPLPEGVWLEPGPL
ncbi:MAG: hypothetical protein KJO38_00685, partial [Gammaproteobacteria bacterium]|nr:hypothetical protein [Gammaproteobacteria bacterium]